jgi:tRNA threonylcarbamoyladenosine biosynthesis protein TsaE
LKTTRQNTGIWLKDAEKTHNSGRALANTIYNIPVTILISGELGCGKTTFLNGFSEALGILEHLPSPTFSLENHHETANGMPFLHIDLYRLTGPEADAFVQQTADFEGFRCIEWAQHLSAPLSDPSINIDISDTYKRHGHRLAISFKDIPLPSIEQIVDWRAEMALPDHIAAHCDAVAQYAVELGTRLMEDGKIVRLDALEVAGKLHDLLRFIDFIPGTAHANKEHHEEPEVWERIRSQYKEMRHEPACAEFLRDKGLSGLADIVAYHGVRLPPTKDQTIEQQLLYYADKRTNFDTIVTLDERFADFAKRYKGTKFIGDADIWYGEAREIEKQLFGGEPVA